MAKLGYVGDDGFEDSFKQLRQEIESGLVSDDILNIAITQELIETYVDFAVKCVLALVSKGFEQQIKQHL